MHDVGPAGRLDPGHESRGIIMSNTDKMKNTVDHAAGAAKEKIGEWTGDESLEAEGRKDEAVADVKSAGEKVKDAARSVKDAVTE
jgi:uncharacterized protein YjbJ (UPF0337 family)